MSNRNDEIEIDLLKLFKALWRRALVIILVALITRLLVILISLSAIARYITFGKCHRRHHRQCHYHHKYESCNFFSHFFPLFIFF